MTKYGLTDEELHIIVSMCAIYTEIKSVILFGSRAMGNFKEASDVDIAIKGKNIDVLLPARLKRHLEDGTDIPYFFDIIDYNTIDNPKLKKHIDELGKVIYEKK